MSGIIKKYVFIIIAVIAYFTISLLPTPTGLEPAGQRSIALMVAAVIIWATEAIPVGYVSLAFPMITGILGVAPIGEVLKNFINASIIFMICTQFISQAFVSTGVGNRVATKFSFLFGTKPKQVLLSFIMVSGVVSMFIGDIPVAVVFGGIAYVPKAFDQPASGAVLCRERNYGRIRGGGGKRQRVLLLRGGLFPGCPHRHLPDRDAG